MPMVDLAALKVKIPRDELDLPERILAWCEECCPNYITNNGTFSQELYYTFYIADKDERAMFKLTWGEYLL